MFSINIVDQAILGLDAMITFLKAFWAIVYGFAMFVLASWWLRNSSPNNLFDSVAQGLLVLGLISIAIGIGMLFFIWLRMRQTLGRRSNAQGSDLIRQPQTRFIRFAVLMAVAIGRNFLALQIGLMRGGGFGYPLRYIFNPLNWYIIEIHLFRNPVDFAIRIIVTALFLLAIWHLLRGLWFAIHRRGDLLNNQVVRGNHRPSASNDFSDLR